MSFNQFDMDLEEADPLTSFNVTIEQISNLLFKINGNLYNLEKLETSLESQKELSIKGNKLEGRILELTGTTTDWFKELNKYKETLSKKFVYRPSQGYSDDQQEYGFRDFVDDDLAKPYSDSENAICIDKNQSLQKDKILREITTSLKGYQGLQTRFKDFMKNESTMIKSTANQQALLDEDQQVLGKNTTRDEVTSAQKQQHHIVKEFDVINNEELAYHTQMVNEREEEIQNIQSSINELNIIFKDLDQLVVEQGFVVDNIENNLSNYNQNVQGANRELTKADRYQRKSWRTRKCLILLCLGLSFALIVAVLAIS